MLTLPRTSAQPSLVPSSASNINGWTALFKCDYQRSNDWTLVFKLNGAPCVTSSTVFPATAKWGHLCSPSVRSGHWALHVGPTQPTNVQ